MYLATAQVFDSEMAEKVAAHRGRRDAGWTTLEEPFEVSAAIAAQDARSAILLDCATLWLTNLMLADRDVEAECRVLCDALRAAPCPVVVVSNEVGLGGIADNALARRFAVAQGRLNQQIAAIADRVALVAGGMPLALKGGFGA